MDILIVSLHIDLFPSSYLGIRFMSSASESSSDTDRSLVESTGTRDIAVQISGSRGKVYKEIHLWAETKLECPVWSISVSRSGILCGCDDGSVVLLNSNLVRCLSIDAHGESPVVHVGWAGDSLHFLSVGTDFTVKVWSLESTGASANSEDPVTCVYALKQAASIVSVCFHPFSFASSSVLVVDAKNNLSHTIFVLTGDRRIGVWTDGLFERYESLSSKDVPVCMSASLKGYQTNSLSASTSETSVFVAVGTKAGDLVLYSYVQDRGIYYEGSISCRNRRGKFSDGTPVISVVWTSKSEFFVATQDNRIRRVTVSVEGENKDRKIKLSVIQKFRGHKSSNGEAPLAAFVLTPPFSSPILQCGSECGRIFVWRMDDDTKQKPNILQQVARKFKPSRARKASESWQAAKTPDKLTAAAPAPWNPERGTIGGSCTVVATLAGYVRLFFSSPEKDS